MAEERWNDGRQYGLSPIGLPHADLATPGSDTERRAFPGLATKSSVFVWNPYYTSLFGASATAPPMSGTINLRKNTSGGASVDVPTWAAGAAIAFQTSITTIGVGITYHQFVLSGAIDVSSLMDVAIVTHDALNQVNLVQAVVPFYDEPLVAFRSYNNLSSALGAQTIFVYLMGFVRNV